jgi:hypothetical protein
MQNKRQLNRRLYRAEQNFYLTRTRSGPGINMFYMLRVIIPLFSQNLPGIRESIEQRDFNWQRKSGELLLIRKLASYLVAF